MQRLYEYYRMLSCVCFLQTQSYLLVNLAVSDLLMGIYLTIVAAIDVHYRGDYARYDVAWKQSKLCTLAGFLSTLSGVLSVLTLAAVTIDRFIVIVINSPLIKMGKGQAKGILVLIWTLVTGMCLIPCFDSPYFQNFYGQSEMCLPISIASDRQSGMEFTSQWVWDTTTETPKLLHERTANPKISRKPSGWEYSLFIYLGLNGGAFLAIVIMYMGMFIGIRRTHAAARSPQLKDDLAIAKKMILIVATNALCWFPTIALAIYCLLGNTVEMRVSCVITTNSSLSSHLFPSIFILLLLLHLLLPPPPPHLHH